MHGDGVRVRGTGAERDNGARGRCTGAREGAGRGPGQSAITVHGERAEGSTLSNCVIRQGWGRDGARGRCAGEGDRGRAR